MADPLRLRPEDRPDFEAVLRLAFTTAEIQNVLSADPTGRAAARLRLRALGDADETAASAREEYGTYLALRASAPPDPPRRPTAGTLLPALTVLTPLVAIASAAALLVLGHLLRLTDGEGTLPGSLITAGWVLTLIAGTSALLAFAALLRTAIRDSDESTHAARVQRSRMDWQQALLERGVLPRLRRYLREDPALRSSPSVAVRTAAPHPATARKEHPCHVGRPGQGTADRTQ
ncbi:hypothetical protein [Streptomyces griseoloalbus]|uniref:Transmembrane protein n=1 Tax=Streptomyces griseoloalbus TaxID=67303 RepID=A0A7W8BT33_9ACTN|nr:hypothetical protein [Streptomyces albaduncus]MBB5128382.1 hypothetical protein [Streptomyces albaduncus]GGW73963.1 membrane protein [Streptomyces albaduncus]